MGRHPGADTAAARRPVVPQPARSVGSAPSAGQPWSMEGRYCRHPGRERAWLKHQIKLQYFWWRNLEFGCTTGTILCRAGISAIL